MTTFRMPQGQNVEYTRQQGKVKYGRAEISEALLKLQPVMTPFVVGPYEDDPYSTIAEAIDAADAVATEDQWAWVFVRPGEYDEGTIDLPPYIGITTNLWLNDVLRYNRNTVLRGGFRVRSDGPRVIFGLDIIRDASDADRCIDVQAAADISLQGMNIQHLGDGGCIQSLGTGAGVGLCRILCRRCYITGAGTDSGANPILLCGAHSYIGVIEHSRCFLFDTVAADRAAYVEDNGLLAVLDSQCGRIETADTATVICARAALESFVGSSVILGAGTSLDIAETTIFWSTGVTDVDGTGTISGQAVLSSYAGEVAINSTVTIDQSNPYVPFVPTVPGDWTTGPTTVLEALDELAARVDAGGL